MTKLPAELNLKFDHAALKPETTESDIIAVCREALEFELYGIAINPVWVGLARQELVGSKVHIVSVAGFPLGASRTDIKIAEAVKAVGDGAHEIDMVANIGWLADNRFDKVQTEIAEVRTNLPYNVLLKVIIECGKLTTEQQVAATQAVAEGGAQFVKTSTGFFGGANVEQVATLFKTAKGKVEVKASGGIRSLKQCCHLIEAGATRLGSSVSAAIMREYLDKQKTGTPDS